MVKDGGKVLLSEPGSTTLLMVTQSFLSAHPAIVADLLKANLQALALIKSDPTKAEADADAEYASYTGKAIKSSLVAASFQQIVFTDDPDEASIATDASEAVSLGLLKEPVALSGMYDLTELNTLLTPPASRPWAPDPPVRTTEMSATEMTTNTVTEETSAVTLAGVSKVYGRGSAAVQALDQVSLSVAPGEFTCLIGASGCGKSTMLSLVAGLDKPTTGNIAVSGRIAMMFQEPALFPWLSAGANVELALRARGVGRAERRQRAAELLETVRLGGFGAKQPHQLSGGMRQRVALARALAQDADVLLMDEPFGALDAMTRDVLHDELDRITATRNLTVLFVTHNVREAVRLGDKVVLLSSRPGRVLEEFPYRSRGRAGLTPRR